ncbi:MAG: UDP-N-acetylmuramate dehydrogenase, partial [Bacteroidetes bacterium]
QNIGAYGVEVKQYITQVRAYHLPTGELHTISREDCAFGYRSSIFKTTAKGQYCITAVEFVLPTVPNLQLAYGDIQKTLESWGIASPTPQDVSRAVVHIRQSKLPNPAEIGNAGSFFKNPEIPKTQWEALQVRFPSLPSYPTTQADMVKVPAGWLIEQAGWKGYRLGDAGVHAKQALVLVNYGNATGSQIWQLAQDIQQDVLEKFGIKLQAEVNLV